MIHRLYCTTNIGWNFINILQLLMNFKTIATQFVSLTASFCISHQFEFVGTPRFWVQAAPPKLKEHFFLEDLHCLILGPARWRQPSSRDDKVKSADLQTALILSNPLNAAQHPNVCKTEQSAPNAGIWYSWNFLLLRDVHFLENCWSSISLWKLWRRTKLFIANLLPGTNLFLNCLKETASVF